MLWRPGPWADARREDCRVAVALATVSGATAIYRDRARFQDEMRFVPSPCRAAVGRAKCPGATSAARQGARHGTWVPGRGSYGRNDIEDAGVDAALLSKAVGDHQPRRVPPARG
jgi:hypothetical protein